MNKSAIASAVIDDTGSKMTPLLRRSVTTKQALHPSVSGNSVIKSIDMDRQIRSGTGSGFNKPQRFCRHMVALPHTSQFFVNCLISCENPGQKNCRPKISIIESRPGCPMVWESCTVWIIFVLNGSYSGIHSLPERRTKPLSSIVHWLSSTPRIFRAGGHCNADDSTVLFI